MLLSLSGKEVRTASKDIAESQEFINKKFITQNGGKRASSQNYNL